MGNFSHNDTNAGLNTRTIVILATIQVVLTTAVISANLFGLLVMLCGRMWRRPSEVFLISLCLADLGLGVLVLPFSIQPEVLGRWPYGETLCAAVASFTTLFVMMSTTGLMVLSVDRLLAIVKPYWYLAHATVGRARNVCVFIWVIEVTLSTGPLAGWAEFAYSDEFGSCVVDPEHRKLRDSGTGSVLFLCIAVVVVTNIVIARVLQRHRRKITTHDCTYRVNTMLHYKDIFRSFAALQYMTLTTLVTLLPAVVAFSLPFGKPHMFDLISMWFIYSNSLWNIIIYSYRTTAFRLRVKKLWQSIRQISKCGDPNEIRPTSPFHIC